MSRTVYRIGTDAPDYEADDLSGKGAEITGGRWNEKGMAVVYAADSRSLACLETLVHLAAGVANFLLNFSIVTAPFSTDGFNAQVAKVNAVARLAIGIPEGLATGLAIWLVFRALYSFLPGVPGEKTFWDLVGRREALRETRGGSGLTGRDAVASDEHRDPPRGS